MKTTAAPSTLRRYSLILMAFAVGTTSVIMLIQSLTAPLIQQHHQTRQIVLFDQLLPSLHYDNNLLQTCYLVTDPLLGSDRPQRLYLASQRDVPVAVVMTSTAPDGYAGAIQLLVATDFQGKVLGVRVLAHHETPGLGDKIERERTHWIEIFTGKQVDHPYENRWKVRRAGGEFDQISGATITSQAVIRGVERSVHYLLRHQRQLTQLPPCPQAP